MATLMMLFRQIVRFLTVPDFWCALLQAAQAAFGATDTGFPIRRTMFIEDPLREVVRAGDETVVLTLAVGSGGDRAFYRELTRLLPDAQEQLRIRIPDGSLHSWPSHPLSEDLFVTPSGWWYVTLDHRDGPATTFVTSDGSRRTYDRPPVAGGAFPSNFHQTIALPGEKPRAIELTYLHDVTVVRRVDWDGATHLWRLPPARREHYSRMVAHELEDGRIVLLSNHSGVFLHLLAPDGGVETVPLRNAKATLFDAVMDESGRMGIIASRDADPTAQNDPAAIDVAVVDPANAETVRWVPLVREVHVARGFRSMRIVPVPAGFAVAWVTESANRKIQATRLDSNGRLHPVVDVGRASAGGGHFVGVQSRGDELLFWWDEDDRLLQRRLPLHLGGFALTEELAKMCEGWGGTNAEHRTRNAER